MSDVATARRVKGLISAKLLHSRTVHGVGTEMVDGDWVVVVHVDPTDPPAAGAIPPSVEGVRIVVVRDAPFHAMDAPLEEE